MQPSVIDVVFTWVDGSDEDWLAAYRAAHAQAGKEVDPARVPHAQIKDELYYAVHSVVKFLGWVRRVYIVTQRPQVPWWLSGNRSSTMNGVGIVVIHHDEFFAAGVTQPTFNSHVIESQVPNLPGLSETFILGNDDFFVGQPMTPGDFFGADGMPVIQLYMPDLVANPRGRPWGDTLRRFVEACGRVGVGAMCPFHVLVPLRKSVLALAVQLLSPDIDNFQAIRTDVDFPVYYVAVNMHARVHEPAPSKVYRFIETEQQFFSAMGEPRGLLGDLPHLFCINVEFTPAVQDVLERAVFG